MTEIDARTLDCTQINRAIRAAGGDCTVRGCCGQRFIGAGAGSGTITLCGIPGNALGAYLDGADITVSGNAQDAVGDTMNSGSITVAGSIGDAAGYAMRGGSIYVRGDAGYRAGIHMKEYRDKIPVIVIGGRAGSFLGEYQAGGVIIVLGLGGGGETVGDFPCTGMHGGRMYLRGECRDVRFPPQVSVRAAAACDMQALAPYIERFCALFGVGAGELLASPFKVVTPDSENPYKQMYVAN